MRLILLLLLSSTAFAQDYYFSKRVLHKISKEVDYDTTIRDTLDLEGSFLKIRLDSAAKKFYVQGLDTFDLRDKNPIKVTEDVTIVYCKGNITVTIWGPWLFVHYPYYRKWWKIYDFTIVKQLVGYSN